MRLMDLNPKWNVEPNSLVVGDHVESLSSKEETSKVGITFDCPCCVGTPKAVRIGLFFRNPIGGDPILKAPDVHLFLRRGDSLETLTIDSDIDASHAGHWRGLLHGGCILTAR